MAKFIEKRNCLLVSDCNIVRSKEKKTNKKGPDWELNPGPLPFLIPKGRIMLLDHQASFCLVVGLVLYEYQGRRITGVLLIIPDSALRAKNITNKKGGGDYDFHTPLIS